MTTMENSPELNWRANLYSSWGPAQAGKTVMLILPLVRSPTSFANSYAA